MVNLSIVVVLTTIFASASASFTTRNAQAWKDALKCDAGEKLAISCFQDIGLKYNVGDTVTEYITCGKNGCGCTATCNGCVGSITAKIVAESGKAATVQFSGLGLGDISFKAGTEGYVTTATNGQYVWSGIKDISHIDVCYKQPLVCDCATLTPSSPCKTYRCVTNACYEVNLADGTGCGETAGECSTRMCSSGQCVSGFKPANTPCGSSTEDACDKRDTCNGAGVCLKNFVSSGSPCGGAPTGACDLQNTCSGTGTCVENLKPAGSVCRAAAGECDVPETCDGSSKTCAANVFASAMIDCGGAPNGACDLQNKCNGAGTCVEKIAAAGTVCRPAVGECDVSESCDGTSKECSADAFKPTTAICGPSTLQTCEIQDYCSGGRTCTDSGFSPSQYSFKCGTSRYLCGKSKTGLCNDGNADTQTITKEQCDGLIASLALFKQGQLNIYQVKCPNGSTVSNYITYNCFGASGVKCEGGSAAAETCSSCTPQRFLRNIFMQ